MSLCVCICLCVFVCFSEGTEGMDEGFVVVLCQSQQSPEKLTQVDHMFFYKVFICVWRVGMGGCMCVWRHSLYIPNITEFRLTFTSAFSSTSQLSAVFFYQAQDIWTERKPTPERGSALKLNTFSRLHFRQI